MGRSLLCLQDGLFGNRLCSPMAKKGSMAVEEDKWPVCAE